MEYLNFSWILPGSLAGSQGPTRRRDLLFLKLKDIRAIIRMEAQTITGESMELVDLYERVPDFSPPTLDQLKRMVLFIQEQIEKWERPVVVSCYAGLGCTGTVLACYLVYTGYTPRAAIDLVRELRPGSIQTVEQEESVSSFDEMLKSQQQERGRNASNTLGDF